MGGTLSWTPPESGRRSGRLTPRTSRVDTTFFAPIPTDRLRTDQKRRLPRHLYSALLCPMTYARRLGLRRQLVGIGPSSWPQQRWPWTSTPTSHHPALSRPSPLPPPARMNTASCRRDRGPISCAAGVTCEELQPDCAAFGSHERALSGLYQAPCSPGPTWRLALQWPTGFDGSGSPDRRCALS